MSRQIDLSRVKSEFEILKSCLQDDCEFDTHVRTVTDQTGSTDNQVPEDRIGLYCPAVARKAATADLKLAKEFEKKRGRVPSFVAAGPRAALAFNPQSVRVALVTAGGIAPGLHCVIHSIVQRHCDVYRLNPYAGGKLLGIFDGFRGLCAPSVNKTDLLPTETAEWLVLGGSKLGCVRYHGEDAGTQGGDENTLNHMASRIASELVNMNIHILYVLGGDGSMRLAHEIARLIPDRCVACLPKTMDNDILWVEESFGFATAVEEAARVIRTLHREADSTRRICVIELFGAESGFVAANATLASGRVDLVLVPEIFKRLSQHSKEVCECYWDLCIEHIRQKVTERERNPHAVAVIAEGVATVLSDCGIRIHGSAVPRHGAASLLSASLKDSVRNERGEHLEVFINEPRHNIRAVPANSRDQIYCKRLGALAVDNALAGYTDFVVSQWLNEYVLVPLALVTQGQKCIPLEGVFWKQVTNSTGQPNCGDALVAIEAEADCDKQTSEQGLDE